MFYEIDERTLKIKIYYILYLFLSINNARVDRWIQNSDCTKTDKFIIQDFKQLDSECVLKFMCSVNLVFVWFSYKKETKCKKI